MQTDLKQHSGSKYIRRIWATGIKQGVGQQFVDVDFYDIVNALGISNPAIQHALKKLMYAGARHKGDRVQDLTEARDAISRAIELETEHATPQPHFIDLEGNNKGCWEVCAAAEGQKPIGFQVRWSVPDTKGRYLWVGHYLTDNKEGSPSLIWCQHAAERNAEHMNKMGRLPTDWSCEYRDLLDPGQ